MLFFFLLLFLKKGKTVVVATRGTDPSYLVIKPDDAGITVNLQSWRPQYSSFVYLLDVPDPSKDGALYPGLALWAHPQLADADKTGRASCRERVCQYV